MKRTSFILILTALLSLLSAFLTNSSMLADYLYGECIGPVKGAIGVLIAGVAGTLVYFFIQSVKQNSGDQ